MNKEILSFLLNINLKVKDEWTIINTLHHTHPVNRAKTVINSITSFLPAISTFNILYGNANKFVPWLYL